MSPQLALELYHLIIHHVGNNTDLRSLALCCSLFRHEAQRCLFGYAEPTSLFHQKQLLSAINGAPLRLGPLVHAFCVDQWATRDHNRLVSLSKALHAMRNLKHLKLHWWELSTILQGCTFQLRTLASFYYLTETEVMFILNDFLPGQRDLKRIEMYLGNPVYGLQAPMRICPHLESLALDSRCLVNSILPAPRLITQFEWSNFRIPLPLTVIQLNHLKSLTLNIRHLAGIDTSFSPHLTSLVKLKLHIVVGEPDAIVNHLQFLQHIPQLQSLILDPWNIHPALVDHEYYLKFSASFQLAFSLCPKLDHIEVTYDHKMGKFARLVRKVTDSGVLSWTRDSVYVTDIREWRYLQ